MRELVVMAFTARGYALAENIARAFGGEYRVSVHRVENIRAFLPGVFKRGNVLVFVGAVGIAVRAVAGSIGSKTTDPAVVVADELGRYVIPILSGHTGGANRFAEGLAARIGAVPVITTATDINNVFAVDAFAAEKGYAVVNPENIRHISGALLEGREVGLHSAFEIDGGLPENIAQKPCGELGIAIGEGRDPYTVTLRLMPRRFHVGVGARRNIPFEDLRAFFLETLAAENISPDWVSTISSIDLKKNEDAIIRLAGDYGIPFKTYTAGELREYAPQFEQSEFVLKETGVGNVCETAAWLSSKKGEPVTGKRVRNGMTIAIAKEAWRVDFGNTNDGAGL